MSVTDARFEALSELYGTTYESATTNDLLARWREDNELEKGEAEDLFIQSFYPELSLTDARLQFWLDGGGFVDDPTLLLLAGAVFWIDADAASSGVNPSTAAVQRLLRRAEFLISASGEV